MNWLQSLVMGLFSGLTDVLPVSSQAHQTLLLNFFGGGGLHPMNRLVIHLATLITLLVCCGGQIGRIRRQLRLARLPRRRRNRTIDLAAVMDAKILKTAFWPILIGLLFFRTTSRLAHSLMWIVAASLINAVILYLPGLFPTADKDSRLVTPMESAFMGIGSGAAVLPGISSVGASYSAGVLHGVDRGYMIHLALMMHMMLTFGLAVYDVLDLIPLGRPALNTAAVIGYLVTGVSAAAGTALGYRILRGAAARKGMTMFSFYSFGVALFTFILYLIV